MSIKLFPQACFPLAESKISINLPELQNFYNKYGNESLSFSIIETCNREQLLIKEQYYIDLYNSVNRGFNICKTAVNYTHTNGSKSKISIGNRGVIHSRESVQKMIDKQNTEIDMVLRNLMVNNNSGDNDPNNLPVNLPVNLQFKSPIIEKKSENSSFNLLFSCPDMDTSHFSRPLCMEM